MGCRFRSLELLQTCIALTDVMIWPSRLEGQHLKRYWCQELVPSREQPGQVMSWLCSLRHPHLNAVSDVIHRELWSAISSYSGFDQNESSSGAKTDSHSPENSHALYGSSAVAPCLQELKLSRTVNIQHSNNSQLLLFVAANSLGFSAGF